jgi:hypothetical protein
MQSHEVAPGSVPKSSEKKECVMILELASPYVAVVVVVLFWALALRPVLRLIHASASTRNVRARREPD